MLSDLPICSDLHILTGPYSEITVGAGLGVNLRPYLPDCQGQCGAHRNTLENYLSQLHFSCMDVVLK